MNEKIRAIAERAGEDVVHQIFDEHMLTETEDGATLKVPAVFIDRFGELMVEACAEYIKEYYPHSYYEAEYMRRNFGVKT